MAAFKVGSFGSYANIAAVAEIVADYPDIPLVLESFLSNIPDQEDMLEPDAQFGAHAIFRKRTISATHTGVLPRLASHPVCASPMVYSFPKFTTQGFPFFPFSSQFDFR